MSLSTLIAVMLVAGATAAPQRPLLGPGPPLGPPLPRPVQLIPGGQPQEIPIIEQNSVINPDGSYQYNYETANGIKAAEQGELRNPGNPELEALAVQGQFSYISDDGTPIQVQYIADENGFQPQGAHLPTPPPIPEAILRALEYNAAHPEEDDDGQPLVQPQRLLQRLPQPLLQPQPLPPQPLPIQRPLGIRGRK